MSHAENRTITLALTGASGADYGLRLLKQLVLADRQVYVLLSAPGLLVVNMETSLRLTGKPKELEQTLTAYSAAKPGQITVFGKDQWTAPIASGTGAADAMVICPCTMGTLAAIAQGLSNQLIERAADVMLKERRPLILVPRESPFSTIHLENMLRLSQAGALILPPNPGFYHHPRCVEDLLDFVVARILDHLHIPHTLVKAWG